MRFTHIVASILLLTFLLTPLTGVFAAHTTKSSVATPTSNQTLVELREYIARVTESQNGTPLTPLELRQSIQEGTRWIKNAQFGKGQFHYEYNPYADTYSKDDNIVRQAGTLYALTEVLRRDDADPYNLTRAVEESLEYFERISKKGTYEGTSFMCVASHGASTRCELGATALVLTAILGFIEHAPGKKSEYGDLMEAYRSFILAMQKRNGGFRSLYLIGRTEQPDGESPFANGEALLALTRLALFNEKDTAVKTSVDRALTYLTKQPFDTAFYLWGMAALKDVARMDPKRIDLTYVTDFTLWRIERGTLVRNTNKNFCAYTEGLVSALSLLKNTIPLPTYTTIYNEAIHGVRKNRALQLTVDNPTRAFMGDRGFILETYVRPLRAAGGFLTGESDTDRVQRIDYTQHCVSASLQMLTDVHGEKLY